MFAFNPPKYVEQYQLTSYINCAHGCLVMYMLCESKHEFGIIILPTSIKKRILLGFI